MAVVGFSHLSLLLAFFIAIHTSEVYPPEVAGTFVENSLAGETFTQQLPADTALVFMTGNFGVCKSKKGIVIPLSELAAFAKEVASLTSHRANPSEALAKIDGIHDIARSFLRMFHGEVGVALLNFPIKNRPPDFIVRADIDESEMSFAELAKKIGGIFGRAPASLVSEEDGYVIIGKKLYVQIRDKKLYASNSRLVIEQFLSGAWKANPLSESPLYQEIGKKVQFDQEQFLFVNVERIWAEFLAAHGPAEGESKIIVSSLFDNMRAVASSTRLSGGSLDVRSAVLFKDLAKGLPKILARPNARSEAATFVPPDYSLFVRAHTGSPTGLLKDTMALHEGLAWGISRVLDRMEKEQGVSVERDLLPALAGDFAVAVKVPPMVGLPESLAVIRIADHDKVASVISTLLTPGGAEPPTAEPIGFEEEYKGAELRIVPMPVVMLTYVFVEGHLLVGSSPEVVRAAIDARLSGKNLASSEGCKTAFRDHPSESFATVYADAEDLFSGLLNIGGGLALWRGEREVKRIVVPLMALLRRNAKDLSPVACSVWREDNAIVVRTNSHLFVAGGVPLLLPWFTLARHVEVREEAVLQRDEAAQEAEELRRRDEMLDRLERERKEEAIRRQAIETAPAQAR